MVNYVCLRCNYKTTLKSNFVRHIRRKNICKYINKDVSQEYIYDLYFNSKKKMNFITEYKVNPIESKLNPNESKLNPNESKLNPKWQKTNEKSQKTNKNDSKTNDNDSKTNENDSKTNENDFVNQKNKYICKFCEKKYSTSSNLCRHLKYCNLKRDNNQEYDNLFKLVNLLNEQLREKDKQYNKKLDEQKKESYEQLREKDKQINELIKKAGITTNIQNNIKVLAYKDTDLSHLTQKDYLYCFNRSNLCIPHLIKKIHFDPQKPENRNIYISNIKNNYVMIYNGEKWIISDRDESIDDLIDKNEFILEQKLEEWIENGDKYPEIMRKFNRYIEKKEKNAILDKIKKEIKLILFNNRDMVKEI